jgi:hypothetical protein
METLFTKHHHVTSARMSQIFEGVVKMNEPGWISVGETFKYYDHLLNGIEENQMFYDYIISAIHICHEAKRYFIERN